MLFTAAASDYEAPSLCIDLQTESQTEFNYGVMASLAKKLQDNQFRGELIITFWRVNKEFCKPYTFYISEDKIKSTEYIKES